jgi:hypothetical protein
VRGALGYDIAPAATHGAQRHPGADFAVGLHLLIGA